MAEGEAAGLVDFVVADSGVGEDGLAVRVGCGFVERAPGLLGWAVSGLVWSVLVVVADEEVELGLEFFEVRGRRVAAELGLRVWWYRSILPWVWGW